MERYEGPIVPGQADDPGDDHDRPLPTCSMCGSLARRVDGVLRCGLHPYALIRWTTQAREDDAREDDGCPQCGGTGIVSRSWEHPEMCIGCDGDGRA